MSNNGKALEEIVAFVEETLMPAGFTVTRSEKRYLDSGKQEAEFDVTVRGRLGSGEISWLIECRDRAEPAGGDWVEQLHGRRQRFGFNKVSAVSTSGYSEGGLAAGKKLDIDLRTVSELDRSELMRWLQMETFPLRQWSVETVQANLVLDPDVESIRNDELRAFLAEHGIHDKILKSIANERTASIEDAMYDAVAENKLVESVRPGETRSQKLRVVFENDADHFVVELGAGPVRIRAIEAEVRLRVVEEQIPMHSRSEYRAEDGTSISQVVTYGPMIFGKMGEVFLEFHRLKTGTHILLRPAAAKSDLEPKG